MNGEHPDKQAQVTKEERTCACRSVDARECMRLRHPAPIGDDAEPEDERCECVCHDEEFDDDY